MSIESHRKAVKKYKSNHYAIGLCVDCSKPTIAGYHRCSKHRMREAVSSSKRNPICRQRYKDSNRCPACSAPLDPDADAGYVNCINCREK